MTYLDVFAAAHPPSLAYKIAIWAVGIPVILGIAYWQLRYSLRKSREREELFSSMGLKPRARLAGDSLAWSEAPEMPRSWRYGSSAWSGAVGGREIEVFSGTGKNSDGGSIVRVPVPPSWPELSILPEYFYDKIAQRIGAQPDLALDSAEFNKFFRINARDTDFAFALLNEDIQRVLLGHRAATQTSGERGTSWVIHNGRLAVSRREPLKTAWVRPTLAAIEEFFAAAPGELNEWVPARS